MLKRFFLVLVAAGLLSPAFGAGTIPGFSLSQQLDQYGKPLANCFFYTIQAGTTSTPQNAYQDSALTIALPNPQRCSASGRLPQMFLADGSVKVKLTSSAGVIQVVADGVLVVGPSGGGGGGSTVDPTTIIATGDIKARYGTGVLSGFVRANGRTIGSATSGASERANADCQSLFEYLWAADANLSVSTGRSGSANADWVANKTIALPDWRGRVIAGLDDMGNSAAGLLTSGFFGAPSGTLATVLGAAGGLEGSTLLLANLPPYTPSVSSYALTAPTLTIPVANLTNVGGATDTNRLSLKNNANADAGTFSVTGTGGAIGGTITMNAQGGASYPVRTVQPTRLATIYVKL